MLGSAQVQGGVVVRTGRKYEVRNIHIDENIQQGKEKREKALFELAELELPLRHPIWELS